MLITGDLHLSNNDRDEYRHTFMQKLPALVKEQEATRVIILGDLTEEKDQHAARLVNRLVDHIRQLARVADVVIVRGNHDCLDPEHPFFQFVRGFEGVRWVNLPDTIDGDLYLPHTRNYKLEWQHLQFKSYERIFTHNTFAGATGDNGQQLAGIPLSVFNANNLVISGDVHVPQRIGRVTYVGAPYLIDFGDAFEPRVLVIRGDQLWSVPTKGAQKRLVEYDYEAGTFAPEPEEGDILKVRVRIAMQDCAHWREIREALTKFWEGRGCKVHQLQPVVEWEEGEREGGRPVQKKSDADLITDYGAARGLDKKTLEVGLELADAHS